MTAAVAFAFPLTHEARRTNHTRDFHSLVCAYGYPVVEHRLIPPATNGGETQKTALVDVGDHKADFIHMPDNGNFWTFIPLTGNKAAQTIKGDSLTQGSSVFIRMSRTSCSSPLTALASHNCCSNSMFMDKLLLRGFRFAA